MTPIEKMVAAVREIQEGSKFPADKPWRIYRGSDMIAEFSDRRERDAAMDAEKMRAALDALMELSEAMLKAGQEAWCPPETCFRAMIQAAKDEGPHDAD